MPWYVVVNENKKTMGRRGSSMGAAGATQDSVNGRRRIQNKKLSANAVSWSMYTVTAANGRSFGVIGDWHWLGWAELGSSTGR